MQFPFDDPSSHVTSIRYCAHDKCEALGTMRCAQCRGVYYCTSEHQRAHWSADHALECPYVGVLSDAYSAYGNSTHYSHLGRAQEAQLWMKKARTLFAKAKDVANVSGLEASRAQVGYAMSSTAYVNFLLATGLDYSTSYLHAILHMATQAASAVRTDERAKCFAVIYSAFANTHFPLTKESANMIAYYSECAATCIAYTPADIAESATSFCQLSRALAILGRHDDALLAADMAIDVATLSGNNTTVSKAFTHTASAMANTGDFQAGITTVREATRLAKSIKNDRATFEAVDCHLGLLMLQRDHTDDTSGILTAAAHDVLVDLKRVSRRINDAALSERVDLYTRTMAKCKS
jgi:tetratricopeptide (TPR) repeat protein